MDGKRKRTNIGIKQKQEIILYHGKNPKASHNAIAQHFSDAWGLAKPLGRRTVGDILGESKKWMAATPESDSRKRFKAAKHEDLEQALWLWFCHHRNLNTIMTDELLRTKAISFGKELGINADFHYSKG